jgi:hypothetical protein
MVMRWLSLQNAAANRSPIRSRRRRGMTVFVVLLVLSMLGAIGIFAARSAQLGVSNAGRHRQMVQTHYVAHAGMQGALAEFGRDPHGYLVKLRNSPSPATATSTSFPCMDIPFNGVTGFEPASTMCLRLGYGAVETAVRRAKNDDEFDLFARTTRTDDVPTPGSFGFANIAANFSIEFTPLTGNGGTKMKYRSVTARAIGQVIPTDDAGVPLASTSNLGYQTSVETIRAEVVVGPVP